MYEAKLESTSFNEMCTQTKVPWDTMVLLADSYGQKFQPWKNVASQPDIPIPTPIRAPSRDIEDILIDLLALQATWSEVLKRTPPETTVESQFKSPTQNQNNNKNQNRVNFDNSQKSCSYWGTMGHTVDECYKALGICSYSKVKGHIRSNYWHKNINRSPPRNVTLKLKCTYCSRNYLGINCQLRNQSP